MILLSPPPTSKYNTSLLDIVSYTSCMLCKCIECVQLSMILKIALTIFDGTHTHVLAAQYVSKSGQYPLLLYFKHDTLRPIYKPVCHFLKVEHMITKWFVIKYNPPGTIYLVSMIACFMQYV